MPVKLNRNKKSRNIAKWLLIVILSITAFFMYRTYQSRLGMQALSAIEFKIYDLTGAKQKAQVSDKLVLANLSAIHCSSCRKLDSHVFVDPVIKKLVEQSFIFARIDYQSEQGKAFMQEYRVSGFPVLLVLDKNGQKLTRLPLTFSAQEFATNLNLVSAVYSKSLNTETNIQASTAGK